jgi:hypothetical protein
VSFIVEDPDGGMERRTVVHTTSPVEAMCVAMAHWPDAYELRVRHNIPRETFLRMRAGGYVVSVSSDGSATMELTRPDGGISDHFHESRPSVWQRVLGWFR